MNLFNVFKRHDREAKINKAQRSSRAVGIAGERFGLYEDAEAAVNDRDFMLAYNAHEIVYAGVNAICRNAAKVPFKIYKADEEGGAPEEIKNGPNYNLLTRPNEFTTFYDFIFSIAAYLVLTGDVYLEIVRGQDKKITALYVLDPSQMEIIKDPVIKIAGYRYTVNGKTIVMNPEDIIHIKAFNPLSEFYGTSKIRPMINTLLLDVYSGRFQKDFFKNGGHPSGIVQVEDSQSQDEFDRFKAQLNNQYTGPGKHHKWLILEKVKAVIKWAVNPNEANLDPTDERNLRKILAVLGVPRLLIQDSKDVSYANAKEQLKVFWNETIEPILTQIEIAFNAYILLDTGLIGSFDYSGVESLRDDQLNKANTTAALLTQKAYTINEVREDFYNKPPIAGGDVLRFSMTEIPEGEAIPAQTPGADPFKTKKASNFKLKDLRLYNSMRDHFENLFQDEIKRYIKGQGKRINEIFNNMQSKRDIKKDLLGSVLNDLSAKQKEFIDKMIALNLNAAGAFADQAFKIAAGDSPTESLIKEKQKELIANYVKKFADEIDKTTLERLRAKIENGLAEGKTIYDIQQDVKETFDNTIRETESRSVLIARTETAKIANYSAAVAYEEAGVKTKIWISAGPPDDRPWHTAANGQEVPINEAFVLSNGARLMFPGDPSAGPGEICNCRCALAPGRV